MIFHVASRGSLLTLPSKQGGGGVILKLLQKIIKFFPRSLCSLGFL